MMMISLLLLLLLLLLENFINNKQTCLCKRNLHVLQITSRPNQSHCLARHKMCHECKFQSNTAKQ